MADRGPYAKGRARRDEILETALRVLAERGYRQTSLRGIGRELGLEPAHILHYFSSREGLLEAVLAAWGPTSDPADEITDEQSARMLEDWLDAVRHNTTIPGLVHLYTAFAAEAADEAHPSHEFFRSRFERLQRTLTAAIEYGQRTGRFRRELDPASAAITLIATSDGLQVQWLINPSINMVDQLRGAIALLERSPDERR
ncbi:MAG: TetR/AcrR family transcriptional regulator [Mycetocola sp.]